jgi:hypothetical protein
MNNIRNPQDYGHLQFLAQAESGHQQKTEIKFKGSKTTCT